MTRIILIDDHAIIRDGIRSLLYDEPALEVVGEASNGTELLAMLSTTPCDVVVLDLNMPGADGFTTIPRIREDFPAVRILVLSMQENERYIAQAINLGALGYALKSTGRTELIYAIRTVAADRPYLCTVIGLALLRKTHAPNTLTGTAAKLANSLSKRELEVLTLIAEGLTNAEIADKLFTSKRTIETHRQNIIEKTQAKNTAALIKFAVSQGILTD